MGSPLPTLPSSWGGLPSSPAGPVPRSDPRPARCSLPEGRWWWYLTRTSDAPTATVRTLTDEFGAHAFPVVADVADRKAIDQGLARVDAELGPIDILVNSAAVNVQGSIFEIQARRLGSGDRC